MDLAKLTAAPDRSGSGSCCHRSATSSEARSARPHWQRNIQLHGDQKLRKINGTEAARTLDHFRRRGVAGVHERPSTCCIRSIKIRVDPRPVRPGNHAFLPGAWLGLGRGHRRREDASCGSPEPCARAPSLDHRASVACAPARPSPSRPRERRRRSHYPLPRSTISVSRVRSFSTSRMIWIFLSVAFVACHLMQPSGDGREEVARTLPVVAPDPKKRVVLFNVIAEGTQHLKVWECRLAPPQRHYQFNSGPVLGAIGVAKKLLTKASNP